MAIIATPRILKDINLFFNGLGFAGLINEVTLPVLETKNEEHQGGGMDAPIDIEVGINKMDITFTLAEHDPEFLRNFGLAINAYKTGRFIGNLVGETDIVKVEAKFVGRITKIDFGTVKGNQLNPMTVMMNLKYYHYLHNNLSVWEEDLDNFVRKVNGIDQFAIRRANLVN